MKRVANLSRTLLAKLLLSAVFVLSLSMLSLFAWRFSRTSYAKAQYNVIASSVLQTMGSMFPQTPVTKSRDGIYLGMQTSTFDNYPPDISSFERAARDAWRLSLWTGMPIAGKVISVDSDGKPRVRDVQELVGYNNAREVGPLLIGFPLAGEQIWIGYPIAPFLYAGVSLASVASYRWGIKANRRRLLARGHEKDWQPLPHFFKHWIISLALALPVMAIPTVLLSFWVNLDQLAALHASWAQRIAIGGVHLAAFVWLLAALEAGRFPAGAIFASAKALDTAQCARCGYAREPKQPCPECGYPTVANAARRVQRWRPAMLLVGVFVVFATTPLWITWLAALSELI